MGKALVIDGLTVSNPLCVVTFTTEVDSLTINKSSLSMTTGDTDTITATVVTSDGTPLAPTFTSSDSTIASVSANGNTATITAVGRGSATITVKAGSKTVTCSVAVAAAPADELAAYYTANQTIAQADKTALNALVTGMSNAGLWAKVKRFYPLLGNTLHDLFLEVKDDSSKGFTDTHTYITSGFTAQTNSVLTGSPTGNFGGTSDEVMGITVNNLAMVSLFTLPAGDTSVIPIYQARINGVEDLLRYKGSDSSIRRIAISASSLYSCSYPKWQQDLVNVLDRCFTVSISSSSMDLYLDGTKMKSETNSNENNAAIKAAYSIFGGTGTTHKFLMILEAMTETEVTTLNGLLSTFFVATGKRSASA